MKIRIASDIHWEFDHRGGKEFWTPSELPDDKETVLILAGDLWWGNLSIKVIRTFNERFKKVLVVLGNHDYWHQDKSINMVLLDYWKGLEHLDNVELLDKDPVIVDGVTFIGCTLWTDFNFGNPKVMADSANVMVADYSNIKHFNPQIWEMENAANFLMIHEAVKKADPVVVVTHHSPSSMSVHSRFKGSPDNYYFHSDYDEYIMDNPNIKLWVHGHMHNFSDYMIRQTRVVANPKGYPYENPHFREDLVINL